MNVFKAIKTINVLYVAGIVAIAVFNNVIQVNPVSSMQDRLLVVLVVLCISIPNMLSVFAIPPKLKFTKTAIVLNVACLFLFVAGLVTFEQERLAIYWGVTVTTLCSINIAASILALVGKRQFLSDKDKLVYS